MIVKRRSRRTAAPITILDAVIDPELFGPWFANRAGWTAWFAFLAALFGLPMPPEQMAVFTECTGRNVLPNAPSSEAWLICGRRSGKSFILALVATYLAVFRDYREYLAPGERATIMIIASDRKQARIIMRYIRALLMEIPMLASLIEREQAEGFDLSNRVTIEVATASFRRTRGYAIAAALLDELAFWPTDDAAEPDVEVLAALRPGMATIPGAILLCASSPYGRRGALWEVYDRWFGRDEPRAPLIWRAATRTMNPTVSSTLIDEAIERDPAAAASEWLAEFRSDVEMFVSLEALRACVAPKLYERRPSRLVRYHAHVDLAGGGGQDSAALAIAHRELDTAIVDLVREVKPPFNPEAVVEQFSDICREYRVTKIRGDRWAGGFSVEAFRRHGINLEAADRTTSELFLDLLPRINSRALDLIDNDRLLTQLVGLERHVGGSGREAVGHRPGGHDDLAAACAGAIAYAAAGKTSQERELHEIRLEGISGYSPFDGRYIG